MESILTLLRFNCPYPDCSFQAVNWPSLERHTLSTHGKVICTLCRSQLSRFAHEQVLYTPHLLPLHDPSRLKRGQRPPKPRGPKEEEEVKSWEAPHPMCEVNQALWGLWMSLIGQFSFAIKRSSVQTSFSSTWEATMKNVMCVENKVIAMFSRLPLPRFFVYWCYISSSFENYHKLEQHWR